MARPGIVLARSGLQFAVERLEEAEKAHIDSPTLSTEANIVRSGCETLFWLFSLNEDFKEIIEAHTSQNIHDWWNSQNQNTAGTMNALRLIRNRVTHSYKYYWKVWDLEKLIWAPIDSPAHDEIHGPAGSHVHGQFHDYQIFLEGQNFSGPLRATSNAMQRMYMKFDLTNW